MPHRNQDGAHNGDPKIDAWNIAYNARLPLGAVNLYSFGTYGKRASAAGNNVRRENGQASFDVLFPTAITRSTTSVKMTIRPCWALMATGRAGIGTCPPPMAATARIIGAKTINPSLGPTGPTSLAIWPPISSSSGPTISTPRAGLT
jgi:iron complex outermembrane receptor protein